MERQAQRIPISGGILTLEGGEHLFYEPLGSHEGTPRYLIYTCVGKRLIGEVETVRAKDIPPEYYLRGAGFEFRFDDEPVTEPNEMLQKVLHVPDIFSVQAWASGTYALPTDSEMWSLVVNYYRTFGDYEEEWHPIILALATFETALLPLLETVFYTTIDGDYGAGKTTILGAMAEVSFHGLLADSLSPPFRARYVGRYNAPLFQDEIDATEGDEGLGLALARTGYRRGAFYGRWDGERNRPEIIEHFGPLNYTLHEDPADQAFVSRSLARVTISKSKNFRLPVINNLRRNVSGQVANALFFWRLGAIDRAIHQGFSLRRTEVSLADFMRKDFSADTKRLELYELATKHLTEKERALLRHTQGREGELAYVALLIERLLGVDVVDQLIEAINVRMVEDRLPVDETETKFLELLRARKGGEEFALRPLTAELEEWCKDTNRKPPKTATIGAWLRDAGFRVGKTKKHRGGQIYLIIDQRVKDTLEGRGGQAPLDKGRLLQEELLPGQSGQSGQYLTAEGGEDQDKGGPPEAKNHHDYPDYPADTLREGICELCGQTDALTKTTDNVLVCGRCLQEGAA